MHYSLFVVLLAFGTSFLLNTSGVLGQDNNSTTTISTISSSSIEPTSTSTVSSSTSTPSTSTSTVSSSTSSPSPSTSTVSSSTSTPSTSTSTVSSSTSTPSTSTSTVSSSTSTPSTSTSTVSSSTSTPSTSTSTVSSSTSTPSTSTSTVSSSTSTPSTSTSTVSSSTSTPSTSTSTVSSSTSTPSPSTSTVSSSTSSSHSTSPTSSTSPHSTSSTISSSAHSSSTTVLSPTTNNGTTASKEPSSTTRSTTVIPTTQQPNNEQNFTCEINGTTKFQLVGTFSLSITYPTRNGTKETVSIQVPETSTYESECTTHESLTFHFFAGWSIVYEFAQEKTINLAATPASYYVSKVNITYVFDDHLPGANMTGKVIVSYESGNDKYLESNGENYYSCKSKTTLKLTDDLFLTTENFKYRAYNDNGDINLNGGSVTECSADEETSSVVPIAVGAALAGLVVIVLIAYLIGRKRSRKTGYENV